MNNSHFGQKPMNALLGTRHSHPRAGSRHSRWQPSSIAGAETVRKGKSAIAKATANFDGLKSFMGYAFGADTSFLMSLPAGTVVTTGNAQSGMLNVTLTGPAVQNSNAAIGYTYPAVTTATGTPGSVMVSTITAVVSSPDPSVPLGPVSSASSSSSLTPNSQGSSMNSPTTLETQIWSGLAVASVAASTYHGYKRNDSVGWAIWWGLMGGIFPIITPVIAIAEGFGKRKK